MAAKHVVLITGGNTGLGYEAVKALYQSSNAYEILIGSRSLDKANAAVSSLKQEVASSPSTLSPVQVDVESDESIDEAFETVSARFGQLDTLINNAGAGFGREIQDGKLGLREGWNKTWDVNVTGAHVMTTVFMPFLLKAQNPRLIFITSGTSSLAETERFDVKAMQVINGSPEAGWPKPPQPNPVMTYRSAKTGLNMVSLRSDVSPISVTHKLTSI